jgi:thymidylate synthase (FAD)
MKPKVTLFSHTTKPLETIAMAIDIWTNWPLPENLTEGELVERFHYLLKQPHHTPFEYINLNWKVENVSRAWQQQLTRHRVGFSYSIQSLRVIDPGDFATRHAYTIPSDVKDVDAYHESMLSIQHDYRAAIDRGESTEVARGLLPLNIHSPVTFSCTYRSLIGLLKQRLCVAAQEEWREVAKQMREAVGTIHPVLMEPLDCMCNMHAKGKGMCKLLHRVVDRSEYK